MQGEVEMKGYTMEEKQNDSHTERTAAVSEERTGEVSSFSEIIGL